MPEPEPLDPSTSLIIRKIVKSGLLEKLVTWLAVAVVGGGASMATRQVSDAQDVAQLAAAKTELAQVKADFEKFRTSYYERQRESRARADADHAQIERDTRDSERYLERRLTRLETRLGIEAPPAAAPQLQQP
jgi:hypothetical protein